MSKKSLDLTGQKFHKLTAIRYIGTQNTTKSGQKSRAGAIWEFKCDCGNYVTHLAKYVKAKGRTAKYSCGCWYPTKKCFGTDALLNQVFIRHYRDGDLSFEDFKRLSQMDCYYCGATPGNTQTNRRNKHIFIKYNGLDRLTNSKPHQLGNVVPCCWFCNEHKSEMDYQTFIKWIARIHDRHPSVI